MHWISREVRELISKHKTSDPFELADNMGYILIPYPFQRIRGMLLVDEGTTYIGYSTNLTKRLQRIVVYHEIAHRLLHTGQNYFMLLKNTIFYPGKFENQANRFVAELILSECHPRPGESIYEFSARYRVPVELVEIIVNK